MGALAQVHVVWMPDDDFQLKNAIEGGASLESLAKGAVQFSRRFTLQEIKQRWVSILYDPVISAEVSARVLEVERNSANLAQKSFGVGGLKDVKCNTKNIKNESIRDHYYARRKRLLFEYRRSMDMEHAVGQFYASDPDYGIEPPLNYIVGDPSLNQFEHQQLDAGLADHCLSQVKVDGMAAASCTGVTSQPFNVLHPLFIPEIFPVEKGSLPKEHPQVYGGTSLPVDCFRGENMGILEDVDMCDANGVPVDPHSIFDTENLLDDYDGLLPDCGVSFDNLEFPLPEISTWDTTGDTSAPMLPVNDNVATKSPSDREALTLTEGGQSLDGSIPGLDACPSESQIAIPNQGDDTRTSDSDEYFAELYGLLHDDCPSMETDDKPPNNNPYYEDFSSLISTSSVDANLDQSDVMLGPLASVPRESQATMVSVTPIQSSVSGPQPFPRSESQTPIVSVPSHSQSLAESSGFVSCVLNTEDSVVPNIDDVILPNVSLSVKDLLESHNHLKTDKKNHRKPEVSTKAQICQLATGNSCNQTGVDFKIPNNLPKAEQDTSVRSSILLPDSTKGQLQELVDSRGPDHFISNGASHFETDGLCSNVDNRPSKTPDDQASSRRGDFIDISAHETVAHPPLSESEEQILDSDEEIPRYSDVEEMVLEMDLGPVDPDIKLKEKVSKYRSPAAIKAIIRMEQGAHSSTHRRIERRGAFAVIHGRNSKHYIKKPEVLLGRGTDDSRVDIDLGAEGLAHKVSRRQAVIRLEADGNFYLKNIGYRLIYKNDLEVATGQTVRLETGNVIEIREMTFGFEEYPVYVRRYLRNLIENSRFKSETS